VDTTPLFDTYCDQRFHFGDVLIYGNLPATARAIWHNNGVIYHAKRYLFDPWGSLVLTETSDQVYNNDDNIWKKRTYVRPTRCYRAESRCVDRRRTVPIKAKGKGGVMLINQIAFDYAEV
jgi:hypothetical protein